ncbi:MAG: DUF6385 domain-containing protein [Peptococcaceae bacterium]|jgi:hypothetical protein|nr:DUF6385 domain-containing protein [Peptococcaceae bacterium]
MPNYKVFQDNPDQARIKIYGNQNLAVNTDTSGNLGITSTGLAITPPVSGLSITSAGLAVTPPASGLSITSTGLAITPPASGLLITSTGLAVLASLGTSDVSEAPIANNSSTAGGPDTAYNVLALREWTLAVVNNSTAANAQALAKLQISPDDANWLDEVSYVTLSVGQVYGLVSSTFMKYARVYYAAVNSASAITLNVYFQAQT